MKFDYYRSVFSDGGHLGYDPGTKVTNLREADPKIIETKFG